MQSDQIFQLCQYIKERESIRIKKEAGEPFPWTDDPILQTYKFTNVHRSDDRTTKEFKVLYNANYSKLQNLYNASLYRYFGTPIFARTVGFQYEYSRVNIVNAAEKLQVEGVKIYTSAYVITNAGATGPKHEKIADFMEDWWRQRVEIEKCLVFNRTWESTLRRMQSVMGFGGTGFMAKEALLDFILVFPGYFHDEDTWSPVGPGARRGINRVYGEDLKTSHSEDNLLRMLKCIYNAVVTELPTLEVNLHDIQFVLCEYDKYQRAKLGEGRPKNKYHRRIA
jgi:alpha-glutamyl/putrescinyl thymine pyrophosphorylase clade 1